MKSQRERVLEMLRAGSCHSNDFLAAKIPRFSARIWELKNAGHNITDKSEQPGKRWTLHVTETGGINKMTYDEAVKVCQEFALKHKLIFEDEGEAGFGRECVGISHGQSWLDFNPMTGTYDSYIEELYMPDFPRTENSYHKHDCLVVLGRGESAVIELAEWINLLKEAGTVEVREFRTGAVGLQALVSGVIGKAVFVPELHGQAELF